MSLWGYNFRLWSLSIGYCFSDVNDINFVCKEKDIKDMHVARRSMLSACCVVCRKENRTSNRIFILMSGKFSFFPNW